MKSEHLIKERSNSTLLNLNQTSLININGIKSHQQSIFSLKREANETTLKTDLKSQKLLKLLRKNYRKFDDEKTKLKIQQEIRIEWKELARKLDLIFLFISVIIIVTSPVILFGKFVIRDITARDGTCGCDRSFI